MSYPGGKSQAGVFQRIINLCPPHREFVELFAGSAAITRLKAPAESTVLVDKLLLAPHPAFPPGTELIQGCGIQMAEEVQFPADTLLYADPPYIMSTRKGGRLYKHEMTDGEHRRLLAALKRQGCLVIVSGYPSAIYDDALAGWNRDEFEVMTRGHTWATEVLWFNFPKPTQLHDFSKVGVNFRERWRIKKKKKRWVARLSRQDHLERAALLSALVDVGDLSAGIGVPAGQLCADLAERAPSGHGVTGRPPTPPAKSQPVLSIFPGIDLLGMGFEQAGFCVVRGPDLIFGGDIRSFHPPAGIFGGMIGGPPCQDFSRKRRSPPTGEGMEMIGHYLRCVSECRPSWFLMENVPGVPEIESPVGYTIQKFTLNAAECGGRQRRLRVFFFGSLDGCPLVIARSAPNMEVGPCVLATEGRRKSRRGWDHFCALQGLDPLELPGMSVSARYAAVGNGVPVYMARVIALSILSRKPLGRGQRICLCGCGRFIQGKQITATPGCRKRMERRRRGAGVTARAQPILEESRSRKL